MATVEEVGDKIRASISAARNEGFRIVPKCLISLTGCCAIGAVIRKDPWVSYMGAAELLDTGFAQVVSVAMGFDGTDKGDPLKEWYQLGQQLRREVEAGIL